MVQMPDLMSARNKIATCNYEGEQHFDRVDLADAFQIGNTKEVLKLPHVFLTNQFNFYEVAQTWTMSRLAI